MDGYVFSANFVAYHHVTPHLFSHLHPFDQTLSQCVLIVCRIERLKEYLIDIAFGLKYIKKCEIYLDQIHLNFTYI